MLTCAVNAAGALVDAFGARRGGAARVRTERLHDALAFWMGWRRRAREQQPKFEFRDDLWRVAPLAPHGLEEWTATRAQHISLKPDDSFMSTDYSYVFLCESLPKRSLVSSIRAQLQLQEIDFSALFL